jgi:hypothetical protein
LRKTLTKSSRRAHAHARSQGLAAAHFARFETAPDGARNACVRLPRRLTRALLCILRVLAGDPGGAAHAAVQRDNDIKGARSALLSFQSSLRRRACIACSHRR